MTEITKKDMCCGNENLWVKHALIVIKNNVMYFIIFVQNIIFCFGFKGEMWSFIEIHQKGFKLALQFFALGKTLVSLSKTKQQNG